jgi:alcohol dehydrogenase
MEFNYPAAPDRYASVAQALGERVQHLSRLEAASRAFRAVRALADDIGIPQGLAGHGLREEDIPAIAEEAMKSGNVAVNPRRAGKDDLAAILRRSL